jgi:hypothetical protein
MTSKLIRIGASFAAAALGTLSMIGDAGAVNLNSHGAAAQPFNAAEAIKLDYIATGARTISTSAQSVILPVVRSPVTAASQSFFIDGSNSPGKTTSFTLSAFTFTGVFQSSQFGSSSLATYDVFLTLSSISTFSYVELLATLPASAGGVLFGVTAVQP